MKAKSLFGIAAIFNVVVGGSLLLGYPLVAPLLGIEGPPTLWFHITAAIVLVFGYAYWRIAGDPVRFREYIILGAIAKLVFVVATYGHWLHGDASGMLALLVTADLVFAAIFVAWLRNHPPAAGATTRIPTTN